MNIVFFSESCGARFEVDPRMAGKKGHCRPDRRSAAARGSRVVKEERRADTRNHGRSDQA